MATAYLISVAPYQTVNEEDKYGVTHRLRGRKQGEKFVSLAVRDQGNAKDFGFDQKEFVVNPGKNIAEDLARAWQGQGVFVSETPQPDAQAVEAANKQLTEYWLAIIEEADKEWSRTKDHRKIFGLAKEAAKQLNVKRDWAIDISSMKNCPACKTPIPQDAIKCSSPACGAILDPEAAYKFFLISEEDYLRRTGKTGARKTA